MGLPGACFALSISVLGIFALPLGILAALALALARRSGGGEALGLLAAAAVLHLLASRGASGNRPAVAPMAG